MTIRITHALDPTLEVAIDVSQDGSLTIRIPGKPDMQLRGYDNVNIVIDPPALKKPPVEDQPSPLVLPLVPSPILESPLSRLRVQDRKENEERYRFDRSTGLFKQRSRPEVVWSSWEDLVPGGVGPLSQSLRLEYMGEVRPVVAAADERDEVYLGMMKKIQQELRDERRSLIPPKPEEPLPWDGLGDILRKPSWD